ncbi:MAG: ABC transporter substrate-binding protein [Geminicoccaceae bacterium]
MPRTACGPSGLALAPEAMSGAAGNQTSGGTMWRGMRMLLVVLATVTATVATHAADFGTMRIGVLKFGTVSWELDVIKAHGLDAKEGFTLEVVPFGGNDAADVALMGGAVDAVVEDWLFVSRQRHDGVPLTFIPYSSSVGAVMVAADSPITSVADLADKRIGVAGGALDKGWLMLQAYAKQEAGIDLARDAEPVYGAPPLLTEKLKSGELDAALNYWHFGARLEAQGYRRLIGIGEVQEALGVPASVPQLGYIFHEPWADAHPDLVLAFSRASRAAKQLMLTDDAEWQRLMPLTRAENEAELDAFMRRYREGIVEHWGPEQQAEAAKLYLVLAELGGERLVGQGQELAPGTFWPKLSY